MKQLSNPLNKLYRHNDLKYGNSYEMANSSIYNRLLMQKAFLWTYAQLMNIYQRSNGTSEQSKKIYGHLQHLFLPKVS